MAQVKTTHLDWSSSSPCSTRLLHATQKGRGSLPYPINTHIAAHPLHPLHPSQGCNQSQQCRSQHRWREKIEHFWPPAQVKGYLRKKKRKAHKSKWPFTPSILWRILSDEWCSADASKQTWVDFFFFLSLLFVRCCPGKGTLLGWTESLSNCWASVSTVRCISCRARPRNARSSRQMVLQQVGILADWKPQYCNIEPFVIHCSKKNKKLWFRDNLTWRYSQL